MFTSSQIQEIDGLPAFYMVKVAGGPIIIVDEKPEEEEPKEEEVDDEEEEDAPPQFDAKLNTFWIGQFQVSQELWQAVMKDNSSHFPEAQRPVDSVSWYDCVEFCNKLSELQELDPVYAIQEDPLDPDNEMEEDDQKWLVTADPEANGYRLPTEAEWEYAAKDGQNEQPFPYAGAQDLGKVGWYVENSQMATFPVGLKAPNELGLYDMSGNVCEWCWDWYNSYEEAYKDGGDSLEPPMGPESGKELKGRAIRGGSWLSFPGHCEVRYRNLAVPNVRDKFYGLRLARNEAVDEA